MKHETQTENIVTVRAGQEGSTNLFFLFTAGQVEELLPEIVTRPVPFSPSFLQGLAFWRGHLLPVIDLEKRFNLHGAIRTGKDRFLVIRFGASDSSVGKQLFRCVLRLSDEIQTMEAPDEMVITDTASVERSLVRGTYQWEEDLYIVPDLFSILRNQQTKTGS